MSHSRLPRRCAMRKHYFPLIFCLAAVLFCSGCKYLAFSHEGAVKATTLEFFGYLDKAQWKGCEALMDPENFVFEFGNGVYFGKGQESIKAYLESIQNIQNRTGMHCEIKSVKKLRNGNILVQLTCVSSITENSATLSFSRGEWSANFIWSKRDAVHWHLRGIKETSIRGKGAAS
jgi:hypothetical protein